MTRASIWRLGGLSWRQFGRELWDRSLKDDVLANAGELSFFLLLAFYPLMLMLSTVFAQMATKGTELRNLLLAYMAHLLPNSASGMVGNILNHLQSGGTGLFSVGIVLLLWSASQGMLAVIRVLNSTYEVNERRSWWKRRLLAVGLTALLMVFILLALTAVIIGGWAANYFGRHAGTSAILVLWSIVRWPLVVSLAFLGFGWVYLLAPSFEDRHWYWVAPGAFTAVAVWIAGSWGLKIYVGDISNYTGLYGSFGAVVVLMLWTYVMSVAILLGGEVNIILENAAARHGDRAANERRHKRSQAHASRER